MKKDIRIQNHQAIKKLSKGVFCVTNLWKDIIPKKSIKTKKVINAPNFVSQ